MSKRKLLKNKTVTRRENKAGKFTTIHHSILHDKRLTSTAYRILTSILSDADDFNLTYKLIENRFDLSENTVRKEFKLLEKCGYMRITPIEKGRGNNYVISEYGNLNKNEKRDDEVLTSSTKTIISKEVSAKNELKYAEYLQSIIEIIDLNEEMFDIIESYKPQFSDENGIKDFYGLKITLESELIKPLRKYYYDKYMEVTENLSKDYPKRIINEYKEWLKESIFKNNQVNIDYKKEWSRLKRKNYSFKTDFETSAFDQAEEEYSDRCY